MSSWYDDSLATQPDDLAEQIRLLIASGAARSPSSLPSAAGRVVPVAKGSGMKISRADKQSELLNELARRIAFPSADTMNEINQAAMNSPGIKEEREGLNRVDDAIRAQAESLRGKGGDPTSALSYLANYFTKGQAKYLPPEKTPKQTLIDYALKAQDDRRDLARAIGDYIGRMHGGFNQTQDTKGSNTTFNITTQDPNLKPGAQQKPRLVPEATVSKFTQGQAAIDTVNSLRHSIAENAELMGPINGVAGLSPFTFNSPKIEKQKELHNQFMLLRQTVGKLFEGGVLRKEDEIKYKKIFADITTDPNVATENMKSMESMLRRDVTRYMQNMGRAGYETSGFIEQLGGTGAPTEEISRKGQAQKKDRSKMTLKELEDEAAARGIK